MIVLWLSCRIKKGKIKDLNIFLSFLFRLPVRPLNCIADASRRSSSSGKYFHVLFMSSEGRRWWRWRRETFNEASHFIVSCWNIENKFLSLIITFYSSSGFWWGVAQLASLSTSWMHFNVIQGLHPHTSNQLNASLARARCINIFYFPLVQHSSCFICFKIDKQCFRGAAATAENMVFSGVILWRRFHVLSIRSLAHINILLCSNKMCGMSKEIKRRKNFFQTRCYICVNLFNKNVNIQASRTGGVVEDIFSPLSKSH